MNNNFEHLNEWVKNYYEKTEIRVSPHNIPSSLVFNELLGRVKALEEKVKKLEKPTKSKTVKI